MLSLRAVLRRAATREEVRGATEEALLSSSLSLLAYPLLLLAAAAAAIDGSMYSSKVGDVGGDLCVLTEDDEATREDADREVPLNAEGSIVFRLCCGAAWLDDDERDVAVAGVLFRGCCFLFAASRLGEAWKGFSCEELAASSASSSPSSSSRFAAGRALLRATR